MRKPPLPRHQTLTVPLPQDKQDELERLAAERNTDATHIVMLQFGPLRKRLRSRINARPAPERRRPSTETRVSHKT